MKDKLEIILGDICQLEVEGILCQANSDLEPEDDEIVARLISEGGEAIRSACDQIEDSHKGHAVITTAGKLPSQFLIHTIIRDAGECIVEEDMMQALRTALNLSKEKMLKSIAMYPMARGRNGIPIKRSAEIIMAELKRHLEGETTLAKVIIALDDPASYEAFEEAFRQL